MPIERLPAEILAAEAAASPPGDARPVGPPAPPARSRQWTLARRAFMTLAAGGLFVLAAYRYDGDWLRIGTTAFFGVTFLALAVIDLENQLLPDKIVLPALVAGLVASPFQAHLSPWDGAVGAAAGFLVFLPIWLWALLTGREGRIMGFGDIKFTALMGAALGLQFLGVALYAGVLLGGIVAAGLLVGRIVAPRALGTVRVMPYGTFLASGGLIALYFGRPIIDRVIEILG